MSVTATPKARTDRFSKLKVGDVISETQYYTVDRIAGSKVQLRNDNGEPITVNSEYVNSCLNTADQYDDTVTVSRTEAIQKFLGHPYTAMCVNFNKKIDEKLIAQSIIEAHENSTPKQFESVVKKSIKNALIGEERTMYGRHHGHTDDFGRVNFVDMKLEKDPSKEHDTRNRLVDPRTINWLIVKGIKYVVK